MLLSRPRLPVLALATPFLLSLLASGCVADLRPRDLRQRDRAQEESCGRGVLDTAAQRQHLEGAAPWSSLPAVSVRFQDSYYGLIGTLACPWPTDPATIEMTFVPGSDTSRASFSDTEGAQRTWGIHSWNTWNQAGQAAPVYAANEAATFWLPTLQYFLELPFRVGDAEIVDCAGPATIDLAGTETRVDRVYLTWGSYAPHPRFDQYLAHVDRRSGYLVRADFTVRDLAGFAKGRVLYRDFRQVGDYWLPHKIQIGSNPPDDMLHELIVESWSLDASPEGLVPDPARAPLQKP